ncbi:hypothetical protein C1H46_017735 [Malus baccata]|uniref:O-methyltransferase domain-containing protein n=1 Tax=Malus baccata TaxID=106549 RepID=A0A540MD31_MALBA|nr:hypothetical protein C1H46_017735 [Malus baccata]
MGLSNGEVGATSHELLGAQAQIWNHMFQFINSMALKCAVQLGIPDVIHNHGQPISLSELIAALNVHPSRAHFVLRLMRILVHSDFFAQHHHVHRGCEDVEEEEAVVLYSLTPTSRLLLKDGPSNTTPLILMILDPVLTNPFHLMGAWLQMNGGDDPATIRTPFEMENGMPFWDLAAQEPRFGNLFNEAMEADSKLLGREWILHDWSDEESVKILKKCKEAILLSKNDEGKKKIIIIDIVVGHVDNKEKMVDKKSIETQLMFDMMMMSTVTGKERSESEWKKIFLAAGFTHYNITHMFGFRSLIELYP